MAVSFDPRLQPTWVYQCYCAHGSLLYVGIARNVERRLRNHHPKPWWSDVDFILCDQYATRTQALMVEQHYITYERPQHNIAGQGVIPDLPHPLIRRRDFARQDGRMSMTLDDK